MQHIFDQEMNSALWPTPLTIAGYRNAAVFPLPVPAMPTRLCRSRATGQAMDWMGEGVVKPLRAICERAM